MSQREPGFLVGSLTLEAKEHIDAVCLSFEDAWRNGEQPCIADYLNSIAGNLVPHLLLELLLLDIEYRSTRQLAIPEKEYLRQFPEFEKLIRFAVFEHDLSTEEFSCTPDGLFAGTGETTEAQGEEFPTPEVLAGRYELKRELGRGGFGRVFVAHDRVLNRLVAVKLTWSSKECR